jgi:hypothetical protein
MRRKIRVVAVAVVAGLVAGLLVVSTLSRESRLRASREPPHLPEEEVASRSRESASAEAAGPGARRDEGVEPRTDDDARRLRDEVIAWALDAGGAVCLEPPDRYLNDLWNVKAHRKREHVPEGTITGVFGPKTGADDWLAAMPARATFHAVDVRYSDVSAQGLDHLSGHEDVHVLVLTGCPHLRSEDLGVVATLPSLEILAVTGADLDDRVLSLLAGARALRRLELTGRGITDAGVPSLLGLSKLEQLRLSNTGVSSASLPLLARMPALSLLSLPEMQTLDRAALDAAR